MIKEEKQLLLDCKNQFEWLNKVFPDCKTTSTTTIIKNIDKILVNNNIKEKEENIKNVTATLLTPYTTLERELTEDNIKLAIKNAYLITKYLKKDEKESRKISS